jgi:hypothetical protein
VFRSETDVFCTRIDFEVARMSGSWKITDVVYTRPDKMSLKQVLSQKIP